MKICYSVDILLDTHILAVLFLTMKRKFGFFSSWSKNVDRIHVFLQKTSPE